MKKLLCIILVFMISACAHIRETAWQGRLHKLCSTSIVATAEKFDEKAKEICNGPAKSVAGQTEGTGNFSHYKTLGGYSSDERKQRCLVYECQ